MKRGTKLPPRKLTTAQQIFCREVVLKDNQSEAYRIAYPKSRKWKDQSVWTKAAELASRVQVKSRIQELRAHTDYRLGEITVERIMQEYARLAFYDPGKTRDANGKYKQLSDMDEDTRRAIADVESIPITHRGQVIAVQKKVVRDLAKKGALDSLAKIKRLFSEDAPVVPDSPPPIPDDVVISDDPMEAAAVYRRLVTGA